MLLLELLCFSAGQGLGRVALILPGIKGQGAGAAPVGFTAASQIGLGDGQCLIGSLLAAGIDQNHIQRGVLEQALHRLRVDKAHAQHKRVHDQ